MSKLGKFAAACVAVACGFVSTAAFGDVYLKPLGADETREIEDGQSWATAYSTVAAAVANVESGVPIRAAKGVYVISATITPASKAVVIRGGYDGASDAEPDPAANPTVFTGDQTLDDVWQHVVPVLGEFSYEKTDTETLVLQDGEVTDPGAYAGAFDGYVATFVGSNTGNGFTINSGVSIEVDGVMFTGFTSHALTINSGENDVARFTNCSFVANRCPQGVVIYGYTGKSAGVENSFANCTFAYNYATGNADGASCVHSQSLLTMTGCTFLSCFSEGSMAANCVNVRWSVPTIVNSTFERCDYVSSTAAPTGNKGPGNIFAPRVSVSGLVFSNNLVRSCLSAAPSSVGVPVLTLNTTSSSEDHFANNIFVGNRVEANPAANTTVSLFNGEDATVYTCVLSCSFVSNQVVAVAPTATSGRYTLATVGFNATSRRLAVVNSSFDSNEMIAPETAGVTALRSRGVAIAGHAANGSPQLGVCNCTFYGPDEPGVYDLVQWGDYPVNELCVVDTLFSGEADAVEPIYADDWSKFRLVKTSVKNWQAVPSVAGMKIIDLETGDIPLVRSTEPVALGVPPVLYPKALVPNIKDVLYVQRCSKSWKAAGEFAFAATFSDTVYSGQSRLVGVMTTWRQNDPTLHLATDLRGNPRTKTDSMRGAVNAYAPGVEGSHALTLAREPFTGGHFEPRDFLYAVPEGGSVTVTAVPKEGNGFDGWFLDNDERYSPDATITVSGLETDLALTARFSVKPVKITFDLNGCGTFVESGTSTVEFEAIPGTAFPSVPAYEESDEWVLKTWEPALPVSVPETDTTYVAVRVPKAVRIIKCVPAGEAGEVQDGTTWATAYGDLNAAVADAGIYCGEVWLRKGLYTLSESVMLKSNVALRGGFAGEQEDEAPDSEANATIVSGDTKGDNKWTGGSTDYVWTDGVFNAPQLTSTVWYPTGNNGDDLGTGFSTPQLSTNVVFAGVTFTGFKNAVLYSNDSKCDDLVFTNCSFFANTTSQADNDGTLHIIGSRFSVIDSRFVGNYHCLYLAATATTSAKATVTGTWFEGNSSKYGGAVVYIESSSTLSVSNCDFVAGWAHGDSWRCGPTISCYGGGSVTVDNCRFLRNQVRDGAMGVFMPYAGNTVKITRSRFIGNTCGLASLPPGRNEWCGGVFGQSNGSLFVKDCEISSNTNTVTALGGGPRGGVYVGNGTTVFVNTTFDGNVHRVATETEPVNAPFVNNGGKLAFVNCMVNGSAIDGNRPEVRLTGGQLCVLNTAFENADADYAPVNATAASQTLLSHSFIRNFAADSVTLGTSGAVTNVTTDGASRLYGPKAQDGAGNVHRGVLPLDRGRNVWLSGTVPYFHDPLVNKSKPWRRADDLTSFAASVTGLTVDSPVLPDALGAVRRNNHVKLGPVIVRSGLTILVR